MIFGVDGCPPIGQANRGEPQYTWGFSTVLGNAIVVYKVEAVLVFECGYCYIHFNSVQLAQHAKPAYKPLSLIPQNAERRMRSKYPPSGFNSLGLAVKSYENKIKPSVINARATFIFSTAESDGIL